MPKGITNEAALTIAEEAFNAGFEAALKAAKIEGFAGMSEAIKFQLLNEAWDNFEPHEDTKELILDGYVLSAGVCEHKGGNEHGNPICLKTGELI